VMSTYAMGVKENQRNDISYVHASGMDPARLVFWVKYGGLLPTEEALQWMKQHHADCYASPRLGFPVPGVKEWQSSSRRSELYGDFCRTYLETARQYLRKRPKDTLWFLDHYWKIGKEAVFWKDLFIAENIRFIIYQVPASENFIPSLAMSEIGGIAAYMERSILFEYCTFIHNAPNHLRFVTGPYSLNHMPEPSFTSLAVQTGALNIGGKRGIVPDIEKLHGTSRIIIAVFDEMPNEWYFGDSVQQMYQTLINLVDMDDRFGLLVKTKKPAVLERLKDIAAELERLRANGKCLVADWTVTSTDAAAAADIVVGVPSTAVFESLLIGARTVVFNPMRSGARVFCENNGLNRRFFEDGENMSTALRRYADGTDDSVGDCSDLVPKIDPFSDERGGERMGEYVQWCLEGFDTGLDRGQTITKANERYAETWGRDKLNQKNVYEPLM
ncbi:MAG: hypothetical protein GY950_22320, partial [bacterium]|nr:hypothetical protein [bacterium]